MKGKKEKRKREKTKIQQAKNAQVQAGKNQANPRSQVRNQLTSQLGQIAFLLNALSLKKQYASWTQNF